MIIHDNTVIRIVKGRKRRRMLYIDNDILNIVAITKGKLYEKNEINKNEQTHPYAHMNKHDVDS